jgi:hypothetical protein
MLTTRIQTSCGYGGLSPVTSEMKQSKKKEDAHFYFGRGGIRYLEDYVVCNLQSVVCDAYLCLTYVASRERRERRREMIHM